MIYLRKNANYSIGCKLETSQPEKGLLENIILLNNFAVHWVPLAMNN